MMIQIDIFILPQYCILFYRYIDMNQCIVTPLIDVVDAHPRMILTDKCLNNNSHLLMESE